MTKAKSADLAWIVVNNFENARKFFKDVLGFKEMSYNPEYGWAELHGKEGGMSIGLSKDDPMNSIKPGQNAVITITVDDVAATKEMLVKKGIKMLGDIVEIPHHVKLQMFQDSDGNHFQLAQMLKVK